MTRAGMLLWSAAMGALLGAFGGIAVLAVLVIGRELGLVPERIAGRYALPAMIALLVAVPIVGAALGFLEGRAKLD